MKKKAIGLLTLAFTVSVIWFGMYQGSQWALNVALVWLWIVSVFGILSLFTLDKMEASDFAFPSWLGIVLDFAVFAAIAGAGYLVLSGFYIVGGLCEYQVKKSKGI